MFVIPSIDILNGECVQLINGKKQTAESFGSPLKWIDIWARKGADLIHVIDLNAALGIGSNRRLITDLLNKAHVDIQIGGGIRTIEYAVDLVQNGAKRVIIGSKSTDTLFLKRLNEEICKQHIMAALDLRNGYVVTNGWQIDTNTRFNEIYNKVLPWVGSILSTDTGSEGLLKGPDKKLLDCIRRDDIPLFVSGGFTCKEDVILAEKLGFAGVVIGRALYKNKFDLKEVW